MSLCVGPFLVSRGTPLRLKVSLDSMDPADGAGVRALVRARASALAGHIVASTPWLAHILWGNRESSRRPDTHPIHRRSGIGQPPVGGAPTSNSRVCSGVRGRRPYLRLPQRVPANHRVDEVEQADPGRRPRVGRRTLMPPQAQRVAHERNTPPAKSQQQIRGQRASRRCNAPHPSPAQPKVPRETPPHQKARQQSHPRGVCP